VQHKLGLIYWTNTLVVSPPIADTMIMSADCQQQAALLESKDPLHIDVLSHNMKAKMGMHIDNPKK
jgi:hypothetical protein